MAKQATLPMAWSPDSKTLALPRGLGVQLVDIASGLAGTFLAGHGDGLTGLAWSPDHKTLAATYSYPDPVTRLLAVDKGQLWRSLPVGAGRTLAWSPDGKTLAVGGPGSIDLWEPGVLSRDRPLRSLGGHIGTVRALAWSPGGQSLASGGEDGSVRLWDPLSGELRATYTEHQGEVTGLSWQTEDLLATLGKDQVLYFLDLQKGKVERSLRGLPASGRFGPRAALLAAPFGGNGLRLWDLETGQPLGTLLPLSGVQPGLYLSVAVTGHYRGSEPAAALEKELVWVVQTAAGQDTLPPEEFSRQYGWKNDPESVRFAK
jgi:WD40 repeat protein